MRISRVTPWTSLRTCSSQAAGLSQRAGPSAGSNSGSVGLPERVLTKRKGKAVEQGSGPFARGVSLLSCSARGTEPKGPALGSGPEDREERESQNTQLNSSHHPKS